MLDFLELLQPSVFELLWLWPLPLWLFPLLRLLERLSFPVVAVITCPPVPCAVVFEFPSTDSDSSAPKKTPKKLGQKLIKN